MTPPRRADRRPDNVRPASLEAPAYEPGGVRLQRVLASAGLGSRRHCEELIAAGRVEVDGRRVTEQGLRIDPQTSAVSVDGMRIVTSDTLVHLALNKPVGVLSAMSDDRGRPTVGDYVADRATRLFHVGRLDADSEGLLFLTNDGELAHRIQHPSFEVLKTYLAEVTGPLGKAIGKRLKAGIELEDGPVAVTSFRAVGSAGSRILVEVVLHEGRNHVVRRLLAEVGHPVSRLVRTAIGPVQLGSLRPGKMRKLSQAEVGSLYRDVGL